MRTAGRVVPRAGRRTQPARNAEKGKHMIAQLDPMPLVLEEVTDLAYRLVVACEGLPDGRRSDLAWDAAGDVVALLPVPVAEAYAALREVADGGLDGASPPRVRLACEAVAELLAVDL